MTATMTAEADADRTIPRSVQLAWLGVAPARLTLGDDGALVAAFTTQHDRTHYAVEASELYALVQGYHALRDEVQVLRDVAARFDEEADDVAQLAVERWREIRTLRALLSTTQRKLSRLVRAWPDDYADAMPSGLL